MSGLRSLLNQALFLEAFHQEQLRYKSGGQKTINLRYTARGLVNEFKSHQILEAFDDLSYLHEGIRHLELGHIERLVLQKNKPWTTRVRSLNAHDQKAVCV